MPVVRGIEAFPHAMAAHSDGYVLIGARIYVNTDQMSRAWPACSPNRTDWDYRGKCAPMRKRFSTTLQSMLRARPTANRLNSLSRRWNFFGARICSQHAFANVHERTAGVRERSRMRSCSFVVGRREGGLQAGGLPKRVNPGCALLLSGQLVLVRQLLEAFLGHSERDAHGRLDVIRGNGAAGTPDELDDVFGRHA